LTIAAIYKNRYQASSITGPATDFFTPHKNQYFRKNHVGSTGCKYRTQKRKSAQQQPIDLAMKSTGQ
jgi:hypothetical protein